MRGILDHSGFVTMHNSCFNARACKGEGWMGKTIKVKFVYTHIMMNKITTTLVVVHKNQDFIKDLKF